MSHGKHDRRVIAIRDRMPLGVEHLCREVARQARYGLFHGVPIRHGFSMSKRGKNKTKRTWKPNVQTVKLYSEALDRRFQLRVTTTALRRIDQHGGLDNYLLNTPEKYRNSIVAERLRRRILAVKGPPKENPHKERFYIEKVLKPGGRVSWEMVSDTTGQRLDKKTMKEVVPETPAEGDVIKTIPPPKPVFIEELRRKYLKPR